MTQHYCFGETLTTEGPLTAQDMLTVLERARAAQPRLGDVPVLEIVDLLDRASRLWARPRYEGRRLALEHLPALVGFSRPMVEKGLDALVSMLSHHSLTAKLRYEMGMPEVLDHWVWRGGYLGYLRTLPLGVVVHVSPGNVFLGAVDSLAHGLLSKNANVLKASSADPFFPLLFAASLKKLDKSRAIAESFAVVTFPGEDLEVQRAVRANADG
ncbi:MAG: aldehyde dehydrogenase family protein, partial [Candidatus Eremiobacterota bacterium]